MTDPSLITDGSAVWAEQEEEAIGTGVARGLFYLGLNLGRDAETSNPDLPFWYLGGPMTGIPQFNVPAFEAAAKQLREQGYNIVSPAELDDEQAHSEAMASPDGAPGSTSRSWASFLSRDVIICSLPTCLGGIFLPGYEQSKGATLERTVLAALGKQIMALVPEDTADLGFVIADIA
jgi:hypothetical protein